MRAIAAGAAVLTTIGSVVAGSMPAAAETGVDAPMVLLDFERLPKPGDPEPRSSRTSIVIQNRQVALRASQKVVVTGDDDALASTESIASVDAPACPDPEGTIEGTFELTLTISGPERTHVLSATARVAAHVNDAAELTSFDLVDLRVATAENGGDPFVSMRGAASGLTSGPTSGRITGSVDRPVTKRDVVPGHHMILAVDYARRAVSRALDSALVAARNGLCIRIEADTSGVTTIGPGGSADIDVRVIDAVTGEVLDLDVEPFPQSGDTDPIDPTPTPTTFRYTAPGEQLPSYRVHLQTLSRRGGDTHDVVFGTGWAFSGVTLTQTGEGVTGVSTWNGQVCGDPLTTPWTFQQTVNAGSLSHTVDFEHAPARVGAGRPDIGTVPFIEPVADPAPGKPPFRLYLDDIAPEGMSPSTQRIEVAVQPATGECSR